LAPAAALNQIARDQAAAQKAVATYAAKQGAKPAATRIAGSNPVVSNIFNRAGSGARSLVGPGLAAAFGAARVATGGNPSIVASETGRDMMMTALGGGIGTALAGPPGGFIGGIVAPTVFAATVGGLKPVDMRYISPADAAQIKGNTSFGGLTTPTFDVPNIPDVTSNLFQNIDFTKATVVPPGSSLMGSSSSADPIVGSVEERRPASSRPVEERRPPVSREMPASPTPSMNELAQMYARQRVLGSEMAKGGELQRRLYEGGAAEGMPIESFMTWVEANPDLAYRLAEKRGLLPEPV
jgi:hypothetical protein